MKRGKAAKVFSEPPVMTNLSKLDISQPGHSVPSQVRLFPFVIRKTCVENLAFLLVSSKIPYLKF